MEKQEIRDMLYALGMRLAKGEIDQNTYNEVSKMLLEKPPLAETGVTLPTTGAMATLPITPLPAKVEMLNCPKCGAPPDSVTQDLSQPLKCGYCGGVYTLRESRDDMQKIRQEWNAWKERLMVGSGMGGSNSIDPSLRHLRFNEKLYPALEKEFAYHLKNLESNAPEIPMIPFKVIAGFSDYRPNPLLVSVRQGDNQWLKMFSASISNRELQEFAVLEEDKRRLRMLHYRVSSVNYYANIACLLFDEDAHTYQIVRHNVQKLQEVYHNCIQDIEDAGYQSYLMALDSRLSCEINLLDVLILAFEQGHNFAAREAVNQLEHVMAQFATAKQRVSSSTYHQIYTVPLFEGIQKDIIIARLFQEIIKCYEVVRRSRPIDFGAFYHALVNYSCSLTTIQSPQHLLALLQSIRRMLAARAGIAPVSVLIDWNWLDEAVEDKRQRISFFVSETGSVIGRHYHPYWMATFDYKEQKSKVSRSRTEREGLILVDATSVSKPFVDPLPANDPLLPAIHADINSYNLLDKQLLALPALISPAIAEQAMQQYLNQRGGELRVTNNAELELIYLPVAKVRYTGKKNQGREVFLGYVKFVDENLDDILSRTHRFLQRYGA